MGLKGATYILSGTSQPIGDPAIQPGGVEELMIPQN